MKVIPKVISFSRSLIAIVDSEKGDLFFFDIGLSQIGDNTDAIFIIGEKRSWMRISRVPFNNSIGL